MDHHHHEVLRDDSRELFLFGERAGSGGTNAADRKKANFRWIVFSDGDRSQLQLRCVVRVQETTLFCGLSLTALASFELPRRQAWWFAGIHACGGQWSRRTGLKVCSSGLGLGALELVYDWMAKEAMTPCTKQSGSLVRAAEAKLQHLQANKDDGREKEGRGGV